MELPLPSLEMRELVGPTDPAAFDNSSGALVFPWIPASAYRSVLDFGCGCGRIARQLFDFQWLERTVRKAGLTIFDVTPPTVRGYQWVLQMAREEVGRGWAEFPEDAAGRGIARPPIGRVDPHLIGSDKERSHGRDE